MREVLEQMKEDCFSLSNHEGLGGWVYSLNYQGARPSNYSSTISIDYYDYYDYYGCNDYYTDTEDEDEN